MFSIIGLQNVCIFGFFLEHQRPARNMNFLEHLGANKQNINQKSNLHVVTQTMANETKF